MEHHRASTSGAQVADDNNNNNVNNNTDEQQLNNNNNNNNTTNEQQLNNQMEINSRSTLRIIERRRQAGRGSRRAQCVFYDRTYPRYRWLLPGWLAEERHMDHGRVYKYFYDTRGNRYNSKNEVLYVWEQSGLVLLDK